MVSGLTQFFKKAMRLSAYQPKYELCLKAKIYLPMHFLPALLSSDPFLHPKWNKYRNNRSENCHFVQHYTAVVEGNAPHAIQHLVQVELQSSRVEDVNTPHVFLNIKFLCSACDQTLLTSL